MTVAKFQRIIRIVNFAATTKVRENSFNLRSSNFFFGAAVSARKARFILPNNKFSENALA